MIEEAETQFCSGSENRFAKDSKQSYQSSIVIPAYNEELRIGPFLKSLVATLPDSAEIIVVSDGTDNTPKIVESFGDRVKLVRYSKRLGKGGAIIEGFRLSQGRVIGFVDADGAIPASEVKRLSCLVSEENPCVVGSRWVKSSRIEHREPLFNVLAGRIFHYLTFLILRMRVKDTQCGIKFFHRSLIKQLLGKVTIKSRMIDIALLFHVQILRENIHEVGIQWRHMSGTRLPILKTIPIMFVTLIGLKLIHSSKYKDNFHFLAHIHYEIKNN